MAIRLPSSLGACCHVFHAWRGNWEDDCYTKESVHSIDLKKFTAVHVGEILVSHSSSRRRLSLLSPAVIALMAVWCGWRSPSPSHLHSNLPHNFSIKLCSAASCRRRVREESKESGMKTDALVSEENCVRAIFYEGRKTQKPLYGHFLLGQSLPGIFWLGESKSLIIDEMSKGARGEKDENLKCFLIIVDSSYRACVRLRSTSRAEEIFQKINFINENCVSFWYGRRWQITFS